MLAVAGFLAVGLVAASASLYSILRIQSQLRTLEELHGNALREIQNIESRTADAVQEAFAYVISGDEVEKQEYLALIEAWPVLAAEFGEIAQLDAPGREAERVLFAQVVEAQRALQGNIQVGFAEFEATGRLSPEAFASQEGSVDDLMRSLSELIGVETARVNEELATLNELLRRTVWFFGALGLLTLAAALAVGGMLARFIARHARERESLLRRAGERQRLEGLGQLARGVAHDFNNILTAIMGNAELARMELAPGSPIAEPLEEIEGGARQGQELVEQVLRYAGKSKAARRTLPLAELADETIRLLRRGLGSHVELRLERGSDDPWVACDPAQIRQLLMNLATNGAEAIQGERGTVEVRIGAASLTTRELEACRLAIDLDGGEYGFVEVRDSGRGMDRETLERIFEPFFSTKASGRGLGLAGTFQAVRAHGGALCVTSEPGRGSAFRLLLPRVEPVAELGAVRGPTPAVERAEGTILVVDDERAVLSVSERMLRAIGYEVVAAVGGREGVRIFGERSHEIAAVLLDLTMPDLDGAETLRQLRAIRSDVRVVLYSGHGTEQGERLASSAPHATFLAKPFTRSSLAQRLREVIAAER